MRALGMVVGVLLFLAGAVWVAQGLNLPMAPRSFMTASRAWVLIGAVTALAGFGLAAWTLRRP
jgi:cytochrome c oxidase assembly factor CtaG